MTFQPDAPLPVTLKAKDWNTILTLLAEGPFRIVGPLIGEIQRQCMAMDEAPAPRQRVADGDVVPLRPENADG